MFIQVNMSEKQKILFYLWSLIWKKNELSCLVTEAWVQWHYLTVNALDISSECLVTIDVQNQPCDGQKVNRNNWES